MQFVIISSCTLVTNDCVQLYMAMAPPAVGVVTSPVPCNAWSPWVNEHKPWLGHGDTERKTLQQLRDEINFCLMVSLVFWDFVFINVFPATNTALIRGWYPWRIW